MTVEKLIEELQKMPKKTQVVFRHYVYESPEDSFGHEEEVEIGRVIHKFTQDKPDKVILEYW